MMINILLNLILILILVNFVHNYIVLPFNNEKSKNIVNAETLDESIKLFLEEEKLYTLISFSDGITSELYLNTRYYYFFLGQGLCRKDTLSKYSLSNTNTFKNISYCSKDIGYIKDVYYAQDKITLFNNVKIDENITLDNLNFLFGINRYEREIYDINKICGYIGLQIEYKELDYKEYNFIKILKKERIIPTYTWSILYFNEDNNFDFSEKIKNNNQGIFVFGVEDRDFKEIYSTEDIRTTNAKPRFGILDWGIIFNDVYFLDKNNNDKSSYQNNVKITFDLESNFIISTKYFFENIEKTLFKNYIENNICFLNEKAAEDGKYLIICNKEFSKYISTFPDLYFYHKELNYTFILKNEELFSEFGDYIYFLIIHKIYYIDYWSIGTLFLKKFPFLFDNDKKTISFINIYNKTKNNTLTENNKEESNSNSKLKSFWSFIKNISIIIGILIGILIGKKIWDKNRKRRANELIDNYQYEPYENNKNNSTSKENQLYELN